MTASHQRENGYKQSREAEAAFPYSGGSNQGRGSFGRPEAEDPRSTRSAKFLSVSAIERMAEMDSLRT
jgi:hypothetical protein